MVIESSMSRYSHHRKKYRIKSELSLVHCNEGTSARTRPFSFEDIMLRRKYKQAGEIQPNHGDNYARECNIEAAADGLETEGDRHLQSVCGGSRPVSEDFGRVSSRRRDHNTYGADEWKLSKDRFRESRNLESNSNSTFSKNPSRNDTTGKSDGHVQNRKRSNRSNEDSRDESGQSHSRDPSQMEIPGEKTNGKSVKEREHKQGTNNDHKRVNSRRRHIDQSRHDRKNEPNERHLRALTGIDKYVDTGRGTSDKKSKSKHRSEGKEKIGDGDPYANPHRMHKPSELLERKGKEPSTGHQEELRPKRKRSGSREHGKDRSRRSSSVSPRAHKRTLLCDQSYSSKDKFQKSYTDTERKRISSNGSNSNQRRYSESSSGLGGYSPRKRKTEAAARTPSPATRSPEHRTAGWDHPATRKEWDISSSVVSDVQSSMQTAPENGAKPSSMTSMTPGTSVAVKPVVISLYSPSSQIHAIDSIQLTQATRPMRRLYVENLPSSASEKAVLECVNSFLLSSGVNHIKGTLPCISCMINKEKQQALLEFLTPEDASAALSMDGRSFSGSILKIRRPKDFVEPTTGVRDKLADQMHSISDKVEDSSHRIFIGGISKLISSEMLMKIAGAFGSLKAFHFEHNEDIGVHYAYLEYVDHLVTQKACAGLNGMRLGGQVLTVVQATPDTSLLENADRLPCYGIPEHAKPLLKAPTRVLKLKHVLDTEGISLMSEAELEEVLEDVKLECARFGSVKSINVVKHIDDSITGKAFASVDPTVSTMNPKGNMGEVRQESNTSEELARTDRLNPPNCITEDVKVDETEKGDAISDGNLSISNKNVCSFQESDDTDKITVSNSLSDDKLVGNVLDEENHESTLDDRDLMETNVEILDLSSGRCTNELAISKVKLVSNDDISDVSTVGAFEMQNKVTDAEALQVEEKIERSRASELDACYVSEEGENKGTSKIGDCFEVGCVLVEFKREEASCMAAHCLHGRLFDDRIVTVEYVDPDLFHKRFPKQV